MCNELPTSRIDYRRFASLRFALHRIAGTLAGCDPIHCASDKRQQDHSSHPHYSPGNGDIVGDNVTMNIWMDGQVFISMNILGMFKFCIKWSCQSINDRLSRNAKPIFMAEAEIQLQRSAEEVQKKNERRMDLAILPDRTNCGESEREGDREGFCTANPV